MKIRKFEQLNENYSNEKFDIQTEIDFLTEIKGDIIASPQFQNQHIIQKINDKIEELEWWLINNK